MQILKKLRHFPLIKKSYDNGHARIAHPKRTVGHPKMLQEF
jgi:hypothetical protein